MKIGMEIYNGTLTWEGSRPSYWVPQYPRNHVWEIIENCVNVNPPMKITINIIGWLPPRLEISSLSDPAVICPWGISSVKTSFPWPEGFVVSVWISCTSISVSWSTFSISAASAESRERATATSAPCVRIFPSSPTETTNSAIGLARAILCV